MPVYRVEDTLAKGGPDESQEPFDWLSGKWSHIHSTYITMENSIVHI